MPHRHYPMWLTSHDNNSTIGWRDPQARMRRGGRLRRLPRRLPRGDSQWRPPCFSESVSFCLVSILADVPPSTEEVTYAYDERGFALHSIRSLKFSRLYIAMPARRCDQPLT